ncbi:uncharacterized protein LOC131240520 [Magnolia sinica]|uniref:uncharacterized protein LOC131240520 n=1 Tax=Magnolia sinica TaxID=86752 RepID=UPI0026589D8A|nr:uncharacterized protein LOC131240520 [Magnolia sinica]
MGCFLACFGSVNRKRRKPAKKTLQRDRSHRNYEPLQPISPLKKTTTETAISPIPEARDKPQDLSYNSRKKVTFDLNVETYIEVLTPEVPNYASETDEEKEREKEEKKARNGSRPHSLSEDNSTSSSTSTGSYPSNHRYQNSINSNEEEEEEEEVEYEDSDFEDEDDDSEEEESFESYFSRSPLAVKEDDDWRPFCGSSPDRKSVLLVKGNARDRSQYVHSVLNPVENLTQWKAIKAKTAGPMKDHQKENAILDAELQLPFSPEPAFKLPKPQIPIDANISFDPPKPLNKEISVNASLSSWLVSSETAQPTKTSMARFNFSEISKSQGSNSSRINEDRPILGALTEEELRQSALSSSPRRSPSRSLDEIPILGTVEVTGIMETRPWILIPC